jgi:hypothetical protein
MNVLIRRSYGGMVQWSSRNSQAARTNDALQPCPGIVQQLTLITTQQKAALIKAALD